MSFDSRPDTHEHIGKVRAYLMQVVTDLHLRASDHDKSKLVSPEVECFDKYTPLLGKLTYGSPAYQEALDGMAPALAHHYACNDHHPEHFERGIAGMDLIQVTEMLCDWKASTERHADGNIAKSIVINGRRFGYSREIRTLLRNTAITMGWCTEADFEMVHTGLRPGGASYPGKKTISLDFDGVLHGYSKGWHGGSIYDPPIEGSLDALAELAGEFTLVISTCREDLAGIWAWLREHDLDSYIEDVTNDKPVATVYVDDRAVRFAGARWDAKVLRSIYEAADGTSAIAGPGDPPPIPPGARWDGGAGAKA